MHSTFTKETSRAASSAIPISAVNRMEPYFEIGSTAKSLVKRALDGPLLSRGSTGIIRLSVTFWEVQRPSLWCLMARALDSPIWEMAPLQDSRLRGLIG